MLNAQFVISDVQWALMEPHYFSKKRDPGRTGGEVIPLKSNSDGFSRSL